MIKLKKYTGNKTYMSPIGELFTPEVVEERYPAVKAFTHIIETDQNEEVLLGLHNLSKLRTDMNIDVSLSEEEAVQAIEDLLNAPQAEETSAEERIAAALEFQNLMSI